MRGRFITVEGTEGVGKSTNLEFIRQQLEAAGIEVVQTREPGGTPLSEDIRQQLLDHRHTGMSSDCELLLMFAARAEHLAKVIVPALEAGKWVLCDRFTDATYAYQGGGRGIDTSRISALENWVQGELRPDATLILDVPVEIGLARASQRGELDRFEREKEEFFNNVRNAYLSLAEQYPKRIHIIDAAPALEVVQSQLADVLKQIMEPNGD
ncbi:dTMP kinase [Solemya pervernicosa gill symbiont]|uniref:Thymidylate kinase n=2 Tax=Gammaproteobacteria incertae sedis TaxID=118884 RepID=A0A1T2L1P3_9GAMM|nr:dTMP kinase [Candidatus Reidiella endopervernicosa]OOZ39017.1 dTMP kinase [Solemya pervernicosa gill symbiont]QKQ26907.1 dTMP kinase [Candidatus Reidiella endopervernicosa]